MSCGSSCHLRQTGRAARRQGENLTRQARQYLPSENLRMSRFSVHGSGRYSPAVGRHCHCHRGSQHDQSVTVVDSAVGLCGPVSDTTRMCSVPGLPVHSGTTCLPKRCRAMLTARTATG